MRGDKGKSQNTVFLLDFSLLISVISRNPDFLLCKEVAAGQWLPQTCPLGAARA